MTKSYIQIQRFPYEEPDNVQLQIAASNGIFLGSTDIYCGVQELLEIGNALRNFPQHIGDEYKYVYGSDNPDDRYYRYFVLRAYTIGSWGLCALQISINTNTKEPDEGICQFSIKAEPAAVNQLGEALIRFSAFKHYELNWNLEKTELS